MNFFRSLYMFGTNVDEVLLSVGQSSERQVTSLVLSVCVSGGEDAGPSRTELINTAPYSGLLSSGRPGSTARPGETLWDDCEEEEDAQTQQEKEMNGESSSLNPDPRNFSVSHVCDSFANANREKTTQTLWSPYPMLRASSVLPTFGIDCWTVSCPWRRTERHSLSEGQNEEPVQYSLNTHWCTRSHRRIQYFTSLLAKPCSANTFWSGLSLVLVSLTKFSMFSFILHFFELHDVYPDSCSGILSNT